ncbi:APC family permease [Acidobacteriota bacterium]
MTELKKDLTSFGLTMLVIGTLIGSGIFLTPSQIAGHLSSPYIILLTWGIGGFIALSGALSFAELGSMFPKTGGVYVYLREAYGPLAGFMFGWASFTVVLTGVLAALVIACTNYISFLIHLSPTAKTLTAIAIVIFITFINILRVKIAEMFTIFFTSMKLVGIFSIIVIGFIWGSKDVFNQSVAHSSSSNSSLGLISGIGLALIGVMWSLGGWQHVTYLSGEARNPQKDIPKAIVLGVLVVLFVYMLTNVSYMRLMPLQAIVASDSIAADAVSTTFPFGGTAIAVIIVFSIIATIFIYTLATPRIYFAMAKDGLFFKTMTKVHPRHHTPVNAIIIQSLWVILLILVWGNFEAVVTYVVFVGWSFVMITALTVIVFRIKRPDAPRPFKTIGYPVTTLVFALALFLFVVNILIHNPLYSGVGVAIIVSGLPFYYYFKRKKSRSDAQ